MSWTFCNLPLYASWIKMSAVLSFQRRGMIDWSLAHIPTFSLSFPSITFLMKPMNDQFLQCMLRSLACQCNVGTSSERFKQYLCRMQTSGARFAVQHHVNYFLRVKSGILLETIRVNSPPVLLRTNNHYNSQEIVTWCYCKHTHRNHILTDFLAQEMPWFQSSKAWETFSRPKKINSIICKQM